MSRPLIILTLAASMLAGAAIAQTPPPIIAPVRAPPPLRPEAGVYDVQSRIYREEMAEKARQKKLEEEKVRHETSPERMARAERVATLLNDGKCADAAKLALNEGDQQLANAVGKVCSKTAKR